MIKLLPLLILFCLNAFANESAVDTLRINVATQTYQCTIAQKLNCTPVNQVEQKIMEINRNGGKISIADAPKGLSVDLISSVDNGNVYFDISICSNKSCSLNNVAGGSLGKIAQSMFGQYNITEKSFFVIGVAFNSESKIANFSDKVNLLLGNNF